MAVPNPIATIIVGGRPYDVYGSEAHGFLVHPHRLAGDPSWKRGGYRDGAGDSYPFAGIDRTEDAGPHWGVWQPFGLDADWYAYDAYSAQPRHLAVFGFARTAEESWALAAASLGRLIDERIRLARTKGGA